ncbi:MAG: lysylphosphatidylglycerol synthase transmembrane domain-containing protein, partial [Polyangiaceae bacterium]
MRRHRGKLAASLLITLGIWLALHKGGLKIVPEGSDFDHVKWWTFAAYLVTLAAFNYFRSVRWRFLLRGVAEVPKKKLLAVSCIGFAAILLMPFRIGEFVRPYLIRTRPQDRKAGEKVITMTAATSSVVAERVIDGLYLSIVLALALVFVPTVHPLPDRVVGIPVSVEHVRMSGYAMLGLFVVAFATIAVFYFARSWAHRTTLAVIGKVSTRLAEKLAGMAEKLADGLHVFGRGRDALGFFVET